MGIFSFFGGNRAQSAPVEASDDVYPVHLLDDMSAVAESVPVVLMRFNDVLDADRLRASLVKVLERDDWRKAAGRFRRTADGKLQLRVPVPFTQQRPALKYSHMTFDVGIEEHPLARQLPKTTAQPSLQPNTDKFASFCWEPGAPGSLADFLRCDDPPLALRITSFQDATLVAVSWSHVLADAVGFQSILTAWCQALAGREDEVIPVAGAREDTALSLWQEKQATEEPYMWEDKMLSGARFLWFAFRFVWEMLWHWRLTARTLFLPASFISKLREEAEKDLPEGAFVSDGDLLCTWFTRLFVSANQWSGPVALLNVVDIRSRVPSIFKPGVVYMQNLTMPSMTFLTSDQALSEPLGTVASEVRQSVRLQTEEAQVRAIYRRAIPYVNSTGRPPLFGHPNMLLVPVSNWSKAKFIELIDFGPAVIRPGDQSAERQNPPGTMLYQITGQIRQAAPIRNTAVIISRDRSRNYWVNLYMAEALLDRIEAIVRSAGNDK